MTQITFTQKSPRGTATIDTSRLLIGTDGRAFLRDSSHGYPIVLSDEQLSALKKHFGREDWMLAIDAVGVLK